MDLDSLNSLLKTAAMWGGVFTAVVGGFALYTETQITKRESARILNLETALADARAKQADAESRLNATALEVERGKKETAEAFTLLAQAEVRLEELRRRSGPRGLDRDAFLSALKGNARGAAMVWYMPDDVEAYSFAEQLTAALRDAGWTAPPPEPLPRNAVTFGDVSEAPPDPRIPAFRRGGGTTGLQVVAKHVGPGDPKRHVYSAIHRALLAAHFSFGGRPDPNLPDDAVTIIVGPR